MMDLVLTERFPVLSCSLVEREAGGPQEIITKGKTIFAGTQRSRLTEFFTTSWSWWALTRTDQRGQSQQQVSPLVRVKLTFTCDERMSYDRARGLNWNPLREGIEIDMMTKSDLVIDFMNNGPVSTHTFASSSLHPHIVIKKDVMSFDSILWDLYQFKRCTLQGWRHSVYSCPCPGRQSSNSWTSLSLFQFTYFQPGLAALRVFMN